MTHKQVEKYCLTKKAAEVIYKPEWEATVARIAGKMFVMIGHDKYKKPIITVKCEPEIGDMYRKQYDGDIVPGYYMNKEHWNSIYVDSTVPDNVYKEMIDMSYALIFESLPKRIKQELS